MQNNLLQTFCWLTNNFWYYRTNKLVAGTVSTVTANMILLSNLLIQSIRACSLWQLEEEGAIKYEYLRNIRHQ